MAKICLMTPGQPSINPRLVKEADALVEVGHDVHVLCSHMVRWADEADRKLFSTRRWTCSYVGGERGSLLYWWTRSRHAVVRRFAAACKVNDSLRDRVLSRVTPELLAAAVRYKADLYVAHYAGALTAAVGAARRNRARVAFDAEDFESGYYDIRTGPQQIDRLIEDVERKCLLPCCYITAASPGIAAAYQVKYGVPMPTSVLNVFPLAERPAQFRMTASNGPMRLYWFSQTIGPGRGLEDVIQAMGKLQGCDIELHLRGLGRREYWKHLEDVAAAAGVQRRAIVQHAPSPPDKVIQLAAEFDVGLALEQPNTRNHDLCLSNKLLSYVLAGNAIAATATAGQRPIIKAIGKAGFLYAPGDIDALADGLRAWCENREHLESARQQAWSLGSHPYNWDVEKKKFLELVDGALEGQEEHAKAAC
jgi:glycosyltransferase involved in cell wall biosynthesis